MKPTEVYGFDSRLEPGARVEMRIDDEFFHRQQKQSNDITNRMLYGIGPYIAKEKKHMSTVCPRCGAPVEKIKTKHTEWPRDIDGGIPRCEDKRTYTFTCGTKVVDRDIDRIVRTGEYCDPLDRR